MRLIFLPWAAVAAVAAILGKRYVDAEVRALLDLWDDMSVIDLGNDEGVEG
jgi:hypothetical protein